ncbi:MAG: hypothetical protein AAFV33_09475 [Chloroflexota bacterium]
MSNEGVYVEYMRLDDYLNRVNPENPKDHDIGAIVSSINRFGFVETPAVDEKTGFIVAGHGRGEALRMMMEQMLSLPARIRQAEDGMWELPVLRGITFRDRAHMNAYLIASNRSSERGGWDELRLRDMLQAIALEDTALMEDTGYDADDLNALLAGLGEDNVPDQMRQSHMGEGAYKQVMPDDMDDDYLAATIKQVVFYFDNAEYLQVMGRLEAIRKATGLPSNTDVFFELLEAYERQPA